MAFLKRLLFVCLKRRRRDPAAWPSRPALLHRARLSVWARSRCALPDRGVVAIRNWGIPV